MERAAVSPVNSSVQAINTITGRKRRGEISESKRAKHPSILNYARMKDALPFECLQRVILRSYDPTTRRVLTAILYHFFKNGNSLGPGEGAIPLPKFFYNHRAFFWLQTTFSFSHCTLNKMHRLTMLTFKNITHLDLSHNSFRDIPQELREHSKRKPGSTLPLLEHLNLSHNNIRSISSFRGSMVSLRVFNLSHNQMRRCPRALIERVSTLSKLYVDYNPFLNPDNVIMVIKQGNPDVDIIVVDSAEENASQ